MKKNVKWLLILVFCVVLYWGLSIKPEKKPERPDFEIVLKDAIYVEAYIDLYDDGPQKPLLNIIESHVIDELQSNVPENAEYEYEIDNSKVSFSYRDRSRLLGWDQEGKEIYPGYISIGTIFGYHKMVENNKEALEALISENKEVGLSRIEPFKGSFTITIGDYAESYEFDYYVVDAFGEKWD